MSIVVPAYNEAARLPNTLQRMREYLLQRPFSSEIIVVLDGPTDATLDIVRGVARDVPQLKILDRRDNRGKGYTVKEGMLAAKGEVRLFCDADNSTDIAHLTNEAAVRPGYDVSSRPARHGIPRRCKGFQAWTSAMALGHGMASSPWSGNLDTSAA